MTKDKSPSKKEKITPETKSAKTAKPAHKVEKTEPEKPIAKPEK